MTLKKGVLRLIWTVDLKTLNKKLSLIDSRRKTGTYVLRTSFIKKLSNLNKTCIIDDFEIIDPSNRKKAEKYYALVIKRNSNKEMHALLEMGYGGCRIIAVSPEMNEKDGEEIIDYFEELVKTQKGHGELVISRNFVMSEIINKN